MFCNFYSFLTKCNIAQEINIQGEGCIVKCLLRINITFQVLILISSKIIQKLKYWNKKI